MGEADYGALLRRTKVAFITPHHRLATMANVLATIADVLADPGPEPPFSIEDFPTFLRGYVRHAGDLRQVEDVVTTQEGAAAWLSRLHDEYGEHGIPAVEALCTGQATALLRKHLDPPMTLQLGAPMPLVASVWMFCLARDTFDTALDSVAAAFIARAREEGGPEAAGAVRDSVDHMRRLASSMARCERSRIDLATKYAAALEMRNDALERITREALELEPRQTFADLALMSGTELTKIRASDEFLAALRAVEAVSSRRQCMSQLDVAITALSTGVEALEALARLQVQLEHRVRHDVARMDRQLVCHAMLAAHDHLPTIDFKPWLDLYVSALEAGGATDQETMFAAQAVSKMDLPPRERRNADWRVRMDDADAAILGQTLQHDAETRQGALDKRRRLLLELLESEEAEQQHQHQQRQRQRQQQRRAGGNKRQKAAEREERRLRERRRAAELEAQARWERDATAAAEAAARRAAEDAAYEAALATRAEELRGGQIDECVVCFERLPMVRAGPCGHAVMCAGCTEGWKKRSTECPYCRGELI